MYADEGQYMVSQMYLQRSAGNFSPLPLAEAPDGRGEGPGPRAADQSAGLPSASHASLKPT